MHSETIFLAAQLEQGGVADHVRRLAEAINSRGGCACAVDRRAAACAAYTEHKRLLGFHFVSYGWARRGIIRSSDIREIRKIILGHHLAVYFHELWIGEARGEPLKNRLIGALQRRAIRRLLLALRPAHVLTSNPVYAAMLADLGCPAEVLPLPGNLPPADADARAAARAWLAARSAPATEARAALFGTIHPEWQGEEAVASWCADAARRGLAPRLLALGRLGPAAPARLAALRAAAPALLIDETGELPAPLLAGLLAECELAFATSPWALIGKSGSAAAFLEAGLPTLVTRDDWRRRRGVTPLPEPRPGLRLWPAGTRDFDWSAFLATRPPAASALGRVADFWIQLVRPRTATASDMPGRPPIFQ
jgi:hypothetical protein